VEERMGRKAKRQSQEIGGSFAASNPSIARIQRHERLGHAVKEKKNHKKRATLNFVCFVVSFFFFGLEDSLGPFPTFTAAQ
jgi:hypothetical protein